MITHFTKSDLYEYINQLKKSLDLPLLDYPINARHICSCLGIKVELIPFKTQGLRGIAFKSDKGINEDVILLNSFRSAPEQNFDCCHEVIHLIRHRNAKVKTFQCFEKVGISQNKFLEWQANEGAAELVVPYKKFIPFFSIKADECETPADYDKLISDLAKMFKVPKTVIALRAESLKYEISQFQQGTSIDLLDIRSNNYQQNNQILIKSYNNIFDYIH